METLLRSKEGVEVCLVYSAHELFDVTVPQLEGQRPVNNQVQLTVASKLSSYGRDDSCEDFPFLRKLAANQKMTVKHLNAPPA